DAPGAKVAPSGADDLDPCLAQSLDDVQRTVRRIQCHRPGPHLLHEHNGQLDGRAPPGDDHRLSGQHLPHFLRQPRLLHAQWDDGGCIPKAHHRSPRSTSSTAPTPPTPPTSTTPPSSSTPPTSPGRRANRVETAGSAEPSSERVATNAFRMTPVR